MKQLLVRNVPDAVVRKLRQRAAQRSVSVEEAHRQVLGEALNANISRDNAAFVAHLLSEQGRVDDLPIRTRRSSPKRRVAF